MRLQMIMGVTALALGVALTAVPAIAAPATPGASNGTMMHMHKHHQTRGKPLYNTMRQQRPANSMGQQQQPAATGGAAPGQLAERRRTDQIGLCRGAGRNKPAPAVIAWCFAEAVCDHCSGGRFSGVCAASASAA